MFFPCHKYNPNRLDNFKETLGNSPDVFVATKPDILSQDEILFSDPTRMFFCGQRKQRMSTALSQHHIKVI